MEETERKKGKIWHRIKYKNSVTVAPVSTSDNFRKFALELKRRQHVMTFMNKIVKNTQSKRTSKVAPLRSTVSFNTDTNMREFCGSCPQTTMSKSMEKTILKKLNARGLEFYFPKLLNEIMLEAKKEFVEVTQQSAIEMKLRFVEKQFEIQPYKHLGKTSNYPVFLQRRKELKSKFILHQPLIRRILNECVTELPYELCDLNASLRSQLLNGDEFQKHIFDNANDAAQRLQEFYRKIVGLVEQERVNAQQARSYLGACTGLVSVNISRTIAHTLLHVAAFTGSKEHSPYLKLSIGFKERLILQPTAEDIIEIYGKFLQKIIDGAKHFYVLEKYKLRGFDDKQIHLCLTNDFIQTVIKQINDNVTEKYKPVLKYVQNLDDEFCHIYSDLSQDNTISISDLIFDEGCKKLLHFKSHLPKVAFIPDNAYFPIGQLIITDYRETLKQTLLTINRNIFNNLSAQHEWENNDICETFNMIYVRATQKPITTEEVIEIGKYMAWVRAEYLDELKERVMEALVYLRKLIELGPLTENHISINAKAINWLDEILPILEENSITYEQLKFEAEEKLQRVIEEINVDIKDVYPLLDILNSMDNIENVRSYLNSITLHLVKIKDIKSKIDWINKEEVSLSFPKSTYSDFEELKCYVYPFYHLLKLCLNVQRHLSVWLDGQFDLINYERVKETVESYYKELLSTQKVYRNKLRQAQDENLSLRFKGTVDDPDMLNWPAPLKLCSKAIKLIQDFEPSLTVIKTMCNEALMKRHWQKMSNVAGFDITPNAGTTLRKIIEIDLKPAMDKYELISFSATKERELLNNLEQMLKQWTDINFQTETHKEIKIITQMEEIEVVADDHLIKVINMLNSIYVKPYDTQVKDFYKKLLKIIKTVQECRQTQQKWLYFFPLFLCQEVTSRIKTESEIFEEISTIYTHYIEMIHAEPNVYTTVNNTNLLEDLLLCNQKFEAINEGVKNYFEKIRTYFPRFYFVANDEMFRILSLTSNPTKINKFLRSLFYINSLRFNKNNAIMEVVSENNEIFSLVQSVDTQKFQGCVEMWLKELENQITDSICKMIQEAFRNHGDEGWVLQWPCQILVAVINMFFTLQGTQAIYNNLQTFQTQTQNQIKEIINLIQGTLTNTEKTKIRNVLITKSNHLNILNNLITNKAKTDQDFEWLSQLRYYQEEKLVVKIFDNCLPYGYEYLGNCEQVIITPMTERCYHAIVLAYKNHLCVNLQGPSDTGKTEIFKSITKAIATFCTFFNISQPVKFETIFAFLKGIASNGSWLVFEEFHKISAEVGSLLAQEILKLSTALKLNSTKIVLNATEISLKKCFIGCTMTNYCKLPENLRVLFRPMVTTTPDEKMITQVTLFSMGFKDWKNIGDSMVTTFRLIKDLLPNTIISIRVIKDILLHCALSDLTTENEIVSNSMSEKIFPKLTSTDLEIFKNILAQTFTSKIKSIGPQQDFGNACNNLNLDASKKFTQKLEEFQNIIKLKKGVFIFGQTYTGKTSLIRVLQTVDNVTVTTFNPKTFTLKQFYGDFQLETNHWCDGILTKYLRQNQGEEQWIVLDGPCDFSWTENLYPTLEKHQQLCLATGEILNLVNKRIIFEVENLDNASPALINRCGIIHMPEDTIGWKPLVRSWIQTTNFQWQKGFEENFVSFFDWVIPPCLNFLQHCKPLCVVNEIGLVKTTIQVLEMLMVESYESVLRKEEDPKNLSSWIQASFIQAVTWGLGCNLNHDSRVKFDEFFKQIWKGQNSAHPCPASIEKIEVGVPGEEMIFDYNYLYKSKGNWKFWPDMLKNEKISESEYLSDIFVPTNETIKYAVMINMHITHNYPLLLVGPSGTGKTLSLSDIILNKLAKNYELSFLTFTSKATAENTRERILSKLFKKKTGRYGPSQGKRALLLIDDFSDCLEDEFGTKSSLELLRDLLDHQKWYNLKSLEPLYIDDINIMATMTTKLHGPNMSSRLLRHFNVFSINELPEESIVRIFTNVLLTKWKKIGFPSDILGTVNQIVAATYHIYRAVADLRPTLEWNFYHFDMRNFARVIQVCSLIKKESADTNKKLFYKLWTHEIFRVLGDRLLDKDKNWLVDTIKLCIEQYFKEDLNIFDNLPKDDQNEPILSKLVFGTCAGRFDETSVDSLSEIALTCLKETKTDLVLFEEAVEHLAKLCRCLSLPNCNLIQGGMSGSGRLTLVKLACLIYNQEFFNIELTENYQHSQWRKTVKSFMKEAGGCGNHCTFFLKEEQIVNEAILEDLDNIIKTGQVPFLYSIEEQQDVLDLVRDSIEKENQNFDGSSESVFLYHHKRCKENLHIVISFNPVNPQFRKTLQTFPSFKRFEIIYVKDWSRESLQSIAQTWIKDLEISPETKQQVSQCFPQFHTQVKSVSNGIYITAGSYLEFVKLYTSLIIINQKKITETKQSYLSALEKMSHAAVQIFEMQKSLADYQPQLEAMTIQAIEMAKQIETETIEVEKASDLVKQDEAIANEQAAAAQILKLDCEADLAQAIPILEDAISALNTLKPTDITLVKSMKNPPDAIKLVMAAVCVIKDVKPDRIPDPSTGRKTIDYWGPSKRILGDMNFLQTLKDFDKDNIKPEIMVKIRKDYLPHKDFKPHVVAKASSAAEGLCKWIIAMDMYDKVAKEVAPKKDKLEKAEQEYRDTVAVLNEKKEQVSRIEQKLADLNVLLNEATRKQRRLQRDVDICKRKLHRAQKLIGGLSEEKIRWTVAVEELQNEFNCLPGDMLLSCAFIAYLGSFLKNERIGIMEAWRGFVTDNNIVFNPNYEFVDAFKKDIDFDMWHLNGLSTDTFFVENGVIGRLSKRWCLYIDPQKQASRWIKIIEKQNGIRTTKFTCPNYFDVLKECISSGTPLLFENIPEIIKPFLTNLITKSTCFKNESEFIKIGDDNIPYNKNFILYLTTNLKHPKYSPDIYNQVTVIDFSLNREALQDRLLTCVVEAEKPTLKRIKKNLNSERKLNKDTLRNLEEKILKTLSESKTDILEDEHALQSLDEAKIISREIQKKQEASVEVEQSLKSFRKDYKSVAIHATNLYFTTFELAKINHMYQFSYSWFIETYSGAIQKAPKFRELEQRLSSLMETLTYELYCKICYSIYEKDKLFFSFLICIHLLMSKGQITGNEVAFLAQEDFTEADKTVEWLPHNRWKKIYSMKQLTNYENFPQFFAEHSDAFEEIYLSKTPQEKDLPEPYNSNFSKLLIVSSLRPDCLQKCIRQFVINELGLKYVEAPFFSVGNAFIDSYILSPILFIIREGSDPINSLENFAKTKNFTNKFQCFSMKDKEDELFKTLFEKAKTLGLWICIQNCHLLPYYLPILDLELEEIDYSNTHENFRLWLTTNESKDFPISLLERSVKIVKEPPHGIRNKMLNNFTSDPINSEQFYTNCPGKHEVFVRFLYSISFLHCVVEERKKFGCYGWNKPYYFNEQDFLITIFELQYIVNNRLHPCKEIINLVENCNYGSHIADKMDYRLFKVIINDYLNKSNVVPIKTDHQDCVNHILELEENDKTEIFGIHENYETVRGLSESADYIKSITQTFRDLFFVKQTENVSETVKHLLSLLPEEVADPEKEISKNPIINLIILQELKSYNELLGTIKKSLQNLQQVVDSSSLMTDDSEKVCYSIINDKVPDSWLKKASIHLHSLSTFYKQLRLGTDYFRIFSFTEKQTICLGYFFKPKAFLTALSVFHCRKQSIPFESVFINLKRIKDVSDENTALISGLYLTGASWNESNECLQELEPNVIHHQIPSILFAFKSENNVAPYFKCPLYMCANYKDSSNFISLVIISSKKCPSYWIKRGAALFCQI